MRTLPLFAALLALPNGVALADPLCSGNGICGAEYVANGWKRIAECTDHNWSYLLQKDERIFVCTGVSGRAGPIEFPCQTFKGNLKEYRAMAARPASTRGSAECVGHPAVTGDTGK